MPCADADAGNWMNWGLVRPKDGRLDALGRPVVCTSMQVSNELQCSSLLTIKAL